MTKRKKPTTKEELEADIKNHPDRGKLDGNDVVRFDLVEIRGKVPRELYRRILEIGGSLGFNKSQVLLIALSHFANDQGYQESYRNFVETKSAYYGVEESTIRSKIFGAYKRKGREAKARFNEEEEEE